MNLATLPAVASPNLLEDYIEHVNGLPLQHAVKSDRIRSARKLLNHHPDLVAWMQRPTPARLLDLHRCKAWPFVTWAAVHRKVKVDAELLLCKPGGVDLSAVYELAYPDDISRVTRTGLELGWSPNWVRQAARHTLPVICTWTAKTVDELGDEDFRAFADGVQRSPHVSASARYRVHTRTFALRDHLFQMGICSQPPSRYRCALTPIEMASQVPQPAIRTEIVRYTQTIQTVLRPLTVYARVKAIRVLCDWLSQEFPDVARLDQLDRSTHIEPFIAWARNRPWRGDNGRGRTISATQFHHDLVDLRVFFEDIARLGMVLPAAASPAVLEGSAADARTHAQGADPGGRPQGAGRGGQARRSDDPNRADPAARHRDEGGRAARSSARLPDRLRISWHMDQSTGGQARDRANRPA